MKYCKNCLYPETKPDLQFNELGVCSACTAYGQRKTIHWSTRAEAFSRLVPPGTQVAVPVSGGKDSTYQILKALELGLRPLAVTAMTDDLTPIGRENLDNIAKIGCDHIEVKLNPRVRRRINKYTLQEIGDISWAEHVSIFTIPARIAANFKIPFLLWGECPQNQYGGPEWAQSATDLDRRWMEEFGGLLGLRVTDIIDAGVATEEDMALYRYPSEEDLKGVRGIFLGHFFPWSGWENANIAKPHGWKWNVRPVEGNGFNHENLDNFQTGIHDRLKYLKLGFGRATDLASTAIRERRMTRKTALKFVRNWDGQFPYSYLGETLQRILSRISMTVDEYKQVEARFANKKLFRVGNDLSITPLFRVQ